MARFDGRVAVVTGGASGIGAAVAGRFAAEGGAVAILDRNREALDAYAGDLRAQGRDVLGLETDVSSPADVERSFAAVRDRWGRLDVLVNNAGVSQRPVAPITEVTDQEFEAVISVNLFGVFLCTRAAARMMVAGGYGRIVSVGSRAVLGEPRMSIYAASKSALEGFTRSLMGELGPHGVTVNIVAPGSTLTPLMQSHPDHAERAARLLPTVPAGRMGVPDDQASAILFLASEEAGYVTGQVLFVTGGRYHSSTPFGVNPPA